MKNHDQPATAGAPRLWWANMQRRAVPGNRKIWTVALAVVGLVLLYSLPRLTIPLINTPQVSFPSVLFYPVGVYVLLALGLDMTVGRTGQINLGYAAFFAGGAYTTALMSTHGVSYYATIVPAILVSAALGLLVGLVSLRVNGDYFAIVTLGVGLVVQEIVSNVDAFGSTIGISSVPPPAPIGGLEFSVANPQAYDWLIFTMILAVCVIFALLYRSSLGRAWAAIREDEDAAALMGVEVRKLKVIASTIGAAPAGLAGSIYAAQVGYISPETFGLTLSILVLAAVALGGKGRIAGVVVGGVLVGYLPQRFLQVDKFSTLLFGAVLVVVMLFFPEGVLGSLQRTKGPAPTASLGARPKVADDDALPLTAVPPAASAQPAAPALEVENARVAFGGVVALDDVTLTVEPGSVTSVIGPNGAGKTTLINAITGVYRLNRGRIVLDGRDVTGTAVSARSQGGIGRTFQNLRLFAGMTVLENVLVAAEAANSTDRSGGGSSPRERASELLEEVGLAPMADTRSDQLPYGAQRRLEIARALALDPQVVLLDEPAAGANTAEKQELMGLIRSIAESGRAVLLVEHDMPLVMGVSTKVVVLNFGEVIACGTPEQVRHDPAVIAAYLGTESHV